jgi:hypothetical protein
MKGKWPIEPLDDAPIAALQAKGCACLFSSPIRFSVTGDRSFVNLLKQIEPIKEQFIAKSPMIEIVHTGIQ